MIKKTQKYTDFNGVEREEDFYFNLTEAELTELELTQEGGFQTLLDEVVKAKDTPSLITSFKKIVLLAYGIKTPDGRGFMKNDQIRDAFAGSEPYSKIFMELATDDKKAAEFVKGILPKDLVIDDLVSNGTQSN